MANLIQIKRGLKAGLPNLEVGELGLATDTDEVFIGTPTGNKLVNGIDIDEFSNELLATLGVKIEDLVELNKDESYTYNELYDYLLIRETNSSDSYLLDVSTGEIKSANKEAPPNPNVSWKHTTFSGENAYIVDIKYNAGGNYRVVPRVERMFISEPPRVGSSLGVGELVNNNPGKYLVAINAGKYNISNPNFAINGPEGVLIIDGVIYEEQAHPNYHAIAFNDRGDVKFFKGINATEILNQGYTSATTAFHPVILDGNKMGAGYIDSPGGALTPARRQVLVGLKNGDYKVYSLRGYQTFTSARDIIYDNEPDVDFAYQLDGGGSLTTYVDDELVYAAERSGSGRRVLDAIVWELKEFIASDIIDLDGNKITYIGNSKLEITGVLSISERERQEMKRDLSDIVNLSEPQIISGAKTFSSPVTFGYNTGHMLKFGSSSGEVNVRTSSGKLMLQNNRMSNYSPIATESWVTTTGKAADSDKLNGFSLNSTRVNNEPNKVMRTDDDGYAHFGWVRMQSGNTTSPVTDVYVDTGTGWLYKKSLALFKEELDIPSKTSDLTNDSDFTTKAYVDNLDTGTGFYRVRIFNEQDELITTQIIYEGEKVLPLDKPGYLFDYGTRNEFDYDTVITEDLDLTYSIIPLRYVQTTSADFDTSGDYTGTEEYIILPKDKTSGYRIQNINVKGVATNGDYLTDVRGMFDNNVSLYLELDYLNTSNVTSMYQMFRDSKATTLDLSSFDTSKVTTMYQMFYNSKATTLDLSSFNTSKVKSMGSMFMFSQVTTLDLSSFDTSGVTNMTRMFQNSQATTGYARTHADADSFNSSSYKPSSLTFVVK